MSLFAKVRRFAKIKRYGVKELCTGRYELRKEYESMVVKAVVEKGEPSAKISTSPKLAPLLIASAVLGASFMPFIVLPFIIYAIISDIRTGKAKKDFKDIKW
jgi:hypothetical protein